MNAPMLPGLDPQTRREIRTGSEGPCIYLQRHADGECDNCGCAFTKDNRIFCCRVGDWIAAHLAKCDELSNERWSCYVIEGIIDENGRIVSLEHINIPGEYADPDEAEAAAEEKLKEMGL